MSKAKKTQKRQLWLITCALSLGILGILMTIFSNPIEIPGVNQGVNQGVNSGINQGLNRSLTKELGLNTGLGRESIHLGNIDTSNPT